MSEESNIWVRVTDPDDLDAMAEIYAQSFDDLEPRLSIEQYLRPPGTWAIIAFVRSKAANFPAGFTLTRNSADEAEVFSIGVSPTFRNQGVGSALLAFMHKLARVRGAHSVFLEVEINNHAALALYNKAGYEVIGKRPDYYRNADGQRVNALVMHKRLENTDNRKIS